MKQIDRLLIRARKLAKDNRYIVVGIIEYAPEIGKFLSRCTVPSKTGSEEIHFENDTEADAFQACEDIAGQRDADNVIFFMDYGYETN